MTLLAYIDEAGQRSASPRSSNHFILSAVVFDSDDSPLARQLLADVRVDLNHQPGQLLHWSKINQHAQRLRFVQQLNGAAWLAVSSVVVCKRHLPDSELTEDQSYLSALRLLLERLSWFARDSRPNQVLTYTLSHVVRFKMETLRRYEAALHHNTPGCTIAWSALDPHGGYIDQPRREEFLQLADAAASATFTAFEPDQFHNVERRYLSEFAARLYRRPPGPLRSYGLKMHPWVGDHEGRLPVGGGLVRVRQPASAAYTGAGVLNQQTTIRTTDNDTHLAQLVKTADGDRSLPGVGTTGSRHRPWTPSGKRRRVALVAPLNEAQRVTPVFPGSTCAPRRRRGWARDRDEAIAVQPHRGHVLAHARRDGPRGGRAVAEPRTSRAA